MDASGNQVGDQYVALLSLAFLQANCGNAECRKELLSMGRELNVTLDINANSGVCSEIIDDGELETDGHSSSSISGLLADLQPAAALQRPGEFLSISFGTINFFAIIFNSTHPRLTIILASN